jgi:hypothetical protein
MNRVDNLKGKPLIKVQNMLQNGDLFWVNIRGMEHDERGPFEFKRFTYCKWQSSMFNNCSRSICNGMVTYYNIVKGYEAESCFGSGGKSLISSIERTYILRIEDGDLLI